MTSVAIGNCGFGFAPVRPDQRERAMLTMTRLEAIPYASMKAGLPWDWITFPQFLDSLDRQPLGVNLLPCVPLGPLITWVIGSPEEAKRRPPTAKTSVARFAMVLADRALSDFLGDCLYDVAISNEDPLISAAYRRSASSGVGAGTAEIQLNAIARDYLQLPRE